VGKDADEVVARGRQGHDYRDFLICTEEVVARSYLLAFFSSRDGRQSYDTNNFILRIISYSFFFYTFSPILYSFTLLHRLYVYIFVYTLSPLSLYIFLLSCTFISKKFSYYLFYFVPFNVYIHQSFLIIYFISYPSTCTYNRECHGNA